MTSVFLMGAGMGVQGSAVSLRAVNVTGACAAERPEFTGGTPGASMEDS